MHEFLLLNYVLYQSVYEKKLMLEIVLSYFIYRAMHMQIALYVIFIFLQRNCIILNFMKGFVQHLEV